MSGFVDFNGDVLSQGDKVAFLMHRHTSSKLVRGVVVGFTPCFVKVRYKWTYTHNPDNTEVTKVSSEKIVRLPPHRQ